MPPAVRSQLRVHTLAVLSDNYCYLLIDEASKQTVIVDPSEASPVIAAIKAQGLTPHALWLTHHHWDHIGGIKDLLTHFAGLEVIAGVYDFENKRIDGQTRAVKDTESWPVFASPTSPVARALEVPGHTLGAIAYVVDDCVFTGDTLFLCGCGRLFEGSMEQLFSSLQKLSRLPLSTHVYCGHEYLEKNLAFARSIEPDNIALKNREVRVGEPATLEVELECNPFLRSPDVRTFEARRLARNHF